MRRVLRPKGLLLLVFHTGKEPIHLDEWWGHQVSADFFFFETEEMATRLREAGFEINELIERAHYPDVEVQTRRAYILAQASQDVDAA